jgi:hypothetical protein
MQETAGMPRRVVSEDRDGHYYQMRTRTPDHHRAVDYHVQDRRYPHISMITPENPTTAGNLHWYPPQFYGNSNSWYHQPNHYDHYHDDRPFATFEPPILPEAFIPPRSSGYSTTPPKVTPTSHVTPPAPFSEPRNIGLGTSLTGPSEYLWDIEPQDILCGRGAPTNTHPGNKAFRELVKNYQTEYLCSKRSDKSQIATRLLEIVHARHGRFLRRVKAAHPRGGRFAWTEIPEQRAYEKVRQIHVPGYTTPRDMIYQQCLFY